MSDLDDDLPWYDDPPPRRDKSRLWRETLSEENKAFVGHPWEQALFNLAFDREMGLGLDEVTVDAFHADEVDVGEYVAAAAMQLVSPKEGWADDTAYNRAMTLLRVAAPQRLAIETVTRLGGIAAAKSLLKSYVIMCGQLVRVRKAKP